MAMIDNGGLSPLGACRFWDINKYAQESACDCQMVVNDKRFLLVPMDRLHWIFRGRIGSKKVRPIYGDLWYVQFATHCACAEGVFARVPSKSGVHGISDMYNIGY